MMASLYDQPIGYDGFVEDPLPGPPGGQSRQPSKRQSISDQDNVPQEFMNPPTNSGGSKPVKFIYSHARLPLRVNINRHDTTDSIITSVKTFFGIHEGLGVSFEDERAQNIIPQFENVDPDTTIQVRLTQEIPLVANSHGEHAKSISSPAKSTSGIPWMSLPAPYASRPTSRNAKAREQSPDSNRKQRSINTKISTGAKAGRSFDNDNTFSDSDAGSVSVTSSRRDVLASADISVENIVEGNRRKGAKFESSELPLFKPPQVPLTGSISSASPQKRFNPSAPSPLPPGNQRYYQPSIPHAYPSPISYAHSDRISNFSSGGHSYAKESHVRSTTSAAQQSTTRLSGGSASGVLPTPAPTVGSAISDEDVALQLMRLGDPNNIPPPRPSASTADDALSGKAELASSAEYSESESEGGEGLPRQPTKSGPARKKLKTLNTALASADTYSSGEDYEDYHDGSFRGESDDILPHVGTKKSKSRPNKSSKSRRMSGASRPLKQPSSKGKGIQTPQTAIPPSPYSAGPPPSKASTSQFASDEEDLSAKPRCQRCRKSKKGCDRQRPCGRCKDAGIGIEGCVSEDEGNGRKGRFGRHMGVPVKKTSLESTRTTTPVHGSPVSVEAVVGTDSSKKRKR